MKHWIVILLVLSAGAAGWFGGVWWTETRDGQTLVQIRQLRANNTQYKLIQPLLAVEFPESTFREYIPLEQKIQNTISNFKASGKADRISVYFRDMQNGHWVGINENENYAPASLLKVPVMIAYLKQAESEPGILKQKLRYDKTALAKYSDNQQESPLVSGQEYTIEELIRNMIVHSDNAAFGLLLNSADKNSLNEIFTDMGVQYPGEATPDVYQLSAKTYSLFFRILRNATFLSRDMSERALELLTETTFQDGLVAGVPEGTVAAHKFGVNRTSENGRPHVDLHDCGIVYHPSRPYVLCVMSDGGSFDDLKGVIKDISQLIYTEIK